MTSLIEDNFVTGQNTNLQGRAGCVTCIRHDFHRLFEHHPESGIRAIALKAGVILAHHFASITVNYL